LTKVLVVDDDTILTDMFRDLLTASGYEVFVANSGPEGIEAARQNKPDAIVLDLTMPGIDGWQVCRAIRAVSQVPILVLSAVVDSEGVMRALEEGADDYLIKPVPIAVLVSYLKRMTQDIRDDR
jgi:DNA-binding response OmpR family regulator